MIGKLVFGVAGVVEGVEVFLEEAEEALVARDFD